jgi:hypothetical protein
VKVFGRTPREYLRFAAVPLAVFAVVVLLLGQASRLSWLGRDIPWPLFAYQATLLALVLRARWTHFGDRRTLLPLFALATAMLLIVDGLSHLLGGAPSSILRKLVQEDGAILAILWFTLVTLLHWVLGAVLLAVLSSRANAILAGLFVVLFFAALAAPQGIVIALVVMAAGALGALVRLVLPKGTRASAWLAYAGSVFLVAFAATFVGGTVSCNLQYGDERTAEQLIAAIESYRQTHGEYPESLQALPAPPPTRFGQQHSPYFYGRDKDSFRLTYPSGFRATRTYYSASKEWESFD